MTLAAKKPAGLLQPLDHRFIRLFVQPVCTLGVSCRFSSVTANCCVVASCSYVARVYLFLAFVAVRGGRC